LTARLERTECEEFCERAAGQVNEQVSWHGGHLKQQAESRKFAGLDR
jgi:hypothetical protein